MGSYSVVRNRNMRVGRQTVFLLAVAWAVSCAEEVRNVDESDGGEEVQTFREYVKKGLDLYEESEEVYTEHRGHSRFVQYNDLSKKLAADSRLVNTIRELARV